MIINKNRYSLNFKALIFIDFQYQSINCYWLLLIIIDFIDYWLSLIDIAGFDVIDDDFLEPNTTKDRGKSAIKTRNVYHYSWPAVKAVVPFYCWGTE